MSADPGATDLESRVAHITALLRRGEIAPAEQLARETATAFPAAAEAVRLHGIALLMSGRARDAREVLQHAVRLTPENADARCNLASALLMNGEVGAAVGLLEPLALEHPGDAAIRNNLANALRAAGDDARAREEYLAALALAPDRLDATLNLAATELSLGHCDAAESRLRKLLATDANPQAWLLLGHVFRHQRRHAEAQAIYTQGAQIAPNDASFPYHAGLMADEQHHYAEAAALYRRALQLGPNLHIAEGQLLFVLRRLYDWSSAAPLSAKIRARAVDGSGDIDPFAFLAEDASAAEQLACARARAARVVRDAQPLAQRLHFSHAPRADGAPLRAGFMSAGFHAHATALLTVAMFEELGKRDDLELHLFATTPDDGSVIRQRLRSAAHTFHDAVAQPVGQLAQRVHDIGIDVLVDVDGWCAGGVPGVFALRPAPVQVNWLAYAGTSGAPFIDYLVADRFLIPEPLRHSYSEAIAYLPRCYQPSDPTREIGRAPPRSAFGLPEDALVFASFNGSWKLNAESFARMCAALGEVSASVLWLLTAGREADTRLRAAAQSNGVDPRRLVFSPSLPHAQHLARCRLADLFLDTNPYNAHTTASDAIWAGCPVLTRPGDTFAARVAGSLNHHLGMPELNARDDESFVATAARCGNDRSVLAALHERLAKQRETSGLFDMRGFADDFAALLRVMVQHRRDGLPSVDIELPARARED